MSSFTLIEVIMVIVILGILVVFARPRFEIFYELKIRGGAKRIISDIRYAQSLATSRHEDYAISFDTADNSYRVYRVSDGATAKDPFTHTDLVVDFDDDSMYRGVNIFSVNFDTTDVLRFNWEGVPYDGDGSLLSNRGTINLHCENRQLTIYVAPQTGRISWQ